ncbi:MAG: RecX family transcriptional regulator [Cellulosilyticaceae bacterium]
MLEITSIEEQKKDMNRVSIFINGQFEFGMSSKDAKRYGLHQGMKFSEEEYKELVSAIQLDKAKYKALDYISYQNRSETEIIKKLHGYEYSDMVIQEVINFLKKYNYINDTSFAKSFTEYGLQFKKKSVKRIQYELYQKGVTHIDMETLVPNRVELEKDNIEHLLEKYHYTPLMEKIQKEKMTRRILSKGFSYGMVKECMCKIDESFDD